MLKYVVPFLVGSVAVFACSSSKSPSDDDSSFAPPTTGGSSGKTGSGGTTSMGTGGTTAPGTGGAAPGTGGTTAPGTGGAAPGTGGTTAPGTGGAAPGTGGAAPGTGGTTPGTGGTVSSMGGMTGSAGAGVVMCSNTDKSTLPIDSTGWVDKTCNTCGIQGAFYWYADADTTASLMCNGAACVTMTPPFQTTAPGPGMCISGKATGMSADWGAGIGLSLNDSGGTNSVKSSFNATTAACGNITGFDITLTGNTGGMPVRIGFATSEDGSTISPFVTGGDPAGTTLALSGVSQVVINNATIPANWMSTDPSPPDPTKIYDLQIQVAADQATAGTPFDLCVTEIKPVINGMESGGGGGSGGGSGMSCNSSSVGTISSNTGVQGLGSSGLGYQNNVNNLGSGSQSVTGAYGSGCGSLKVNTSGIKSNNDSPASYPSLVDGWHFGSWNGAYSQGSVKALSGLGSVTSSWAFTPPAGNKWDVAYDMWVAQSTSISAPDSNTLEVMVWLDYSNAVTTNPIGTQMGTFSAAGTTWEVWYGSTGSWHTVTYRRPPGTGAVTALDLLQFLKDGVTHGTGSLSWDLLSVEAGFELFDATSGGSIDSYSCSIN